MKSYNIKGKEIKPHNILFAATTPITYEMERLILLEHMPDTDYDDVVLLERLSL